METNWINEVSDHAGAILHDALYPPRETPRGIPRKAAVVGPQFYVTSGSGREPTKRKDIQPYDEMNIHTWTAQPFNQPSPSRKASLQRTSSIRRSSKGNLIRLTPTGTFYPVVDTNRDSKQTTRSEALSSNRRTPRSIVSEPWNKNDVIVAGQNSHQQVISRIPRKDLTLQVATKRTGELITAINQHSRNTNNNNNHLSGTINDENHHQRERTNHDEDEVYSVDADHDPSAGRPSAYHEDNVHEEFEDQYPLGEMQELTSFSQLYDTVFNGDIVALLGSFAAERFKREQQQAAAGAPTKTLLNKLVRPSTGHHQQRHSSPSREGKLLHRPHSSPAIVDVANMGDDGTTATPNTKRIRDEMQWATGAGSLYLEMAAALLANKELRDIIFTTEEFQKIVKEEQAHVAMLQNHRTTPQSVFRDALLFFDKLPHTSKFLEGCVCIALSNCPPIAAIVDIYDKQWRILTQAHSRSRSRSPTGGVLPIRSSSAAHSPTSRPKSSRWGGHGGVDGINNGMPSAALAIITDETADADAGIDFDDGESEHDDEHDFADQLLQLPDFHRAKVAAAEKVAIFPQPRTVSAKKPTVAKQERVQSPPKIRLASGKDLMARTYERPSVTSQTSLLSKELPRGRQQKKKRPHSSFGTSIRIHWPTREWKLKKYEQFSFASYSAGPVPGQEYLDRARQFEERIPLVQRVQSATSNRTSLDLCTQPRERLRDDPRGSPLTFTNGGIVKRLASAHRKEIVSPHTSSNSPSSSHHSTEMYPQLRGAQSPSMVGDGMARLIPQPSFVRRKRSEQIHQAAADMLIEEDEEARERKTMKGYSTRFWWKHDAFFTTEKKEKSPSSYGHYPPRLYHNAPENLAPPDEQYPSVRRVPVLQLLFQSFMRELLLQTLAHVLETGDDEVDMSSPNQQPQQQPYQQQQQQQQQQQYQQHHHRSAPTVADTRYQQHDDIDDMVRGLDYSQDEFLPQQGGPEVVADAVRLRPRSAILPHISAARESEHRQISGNQRAVQPPPSSSSIPASVAVAPGPVDSSANNNTNSNNNLVRSGRKEEDHVKSRMRSSSRSSTSSGKIRIAPNILNADMLVGHLYQDVQDAVAMMGVLDSDVQRSSKQVEQFDARTGGSRRGSTVRHSLPGHFELQRDPSSASVRRLNLIFNDVREPKAVLDGVNQLRKQYDELQQQNIMLSKKVLQVTSSTRAVEGSNQ